MIKIFIRGANDIGSAVAHRLFMAGYSVVIHETPQPTSARRGMAFTDAVFDGHAALAGVRAERVDDDSRLPEILAGHAFLPVTLSDLPALIQILQPDILIDARMRKHLPPDPQRGLAPLTLGLGPNFVAGETVDCAIETGWGEALGQAIWNGASSPLAGEPREIGGHARDRYVYAPAAGTFHTAFQIGDSVLQGQEVARIDSTPLLAPIAGVLRGLTHDGVPVQVKTKVIEVDPRGQGAQVSGLGERPARIAAGVFLAIQSWEANHVH